MASVALVTGAGRPFGERLAARLSAEPSIERIIAVDTVPPRRALGGRAEFVRADIRHPLIGTVLDQAGVDTVFHTLTRDDDAAGLAALLAACERSRTLTRFVAESSTAVYGARASTPSVCSEQAPVDDAAETLLRAFGRHRQDVTVTTLRFAGVVGAGFDSPAMRHLGGAVVATALGFDPRLQLLHLDDALDVAAQACVERHPGPFNVAGAGVLTLAQIARRTGRLRVGAPTRWAGGDAAGLRFGRVVDTARLVTRFGFLPRYTTEQALAAALPVGALRGRVPALAAGVLSAAERLVRT